MRPERAGRGHGNEVAVPPVASRPCGIRPHRTTVPVTTIPPPELGAARPPALPAAFYDREPALVARELLGAVLRIVDETGEAVSGRIVETEAYLGPHDPACHAVAGRTPRTWHLFGPPGTAYVYFIYGMHWCVNAVTREDGFGSAVLIRALEPLEGIPRMRLRRPKARRDAQLCNGPGKLCAALAIDRTLDGASLTGASRLTIHAGHPIPDARVSVGPRIGITKAADWPLRYLASSD
ncbi:MAG: DNA-3-methyladenine glycosylase [Gemmatimonadaceae bacterium]|nr:DNA-3-methyladenine glycosylase [Gemmatimonadaceae bacterium]MCC6429926.1 DNA-3-methyladenine glycosylase [Gemmatimonadaceae bacterium]